MIQKIVLILAVLALVASAGTIPAHGIYKFSLDRPSVVKGTVLTPGEYKISLGDAKVTITTNKGKVALETAAKIESAPKKYADTVVGFDSENGKPQITEIRLGGTTTKVVFE